MCGPYAYSRRSGMRRRLLCLGLVFLIGFSARVDRCWAQELGDVVMPKLDAKFKVGSTIVGSDQIELPLTVEKVEGEWLWVGEAWILRPYTVAIEHAAEYYSNVLKRRPKDAKAYSLRGFVHSYHGNTERAISDFSASLRIDANDAQTLTFRGNAYLKEGNAERAALTLNACCDCILRNPPHTTVGHWHASWRKILKVPWLISSVAWNSIHAMRARS